MDQFMNEFSILTAISITGWLFTEAPFRCFTSLFYERFAFVIFKERYTCLYLMRTFGFRV